MEDLNQHQLILLVLLVSFVTSIGTGIITVSLLQEAPPVVTSTVNRVVEKTIETVVQGPETSTNNGTTETVREVTVVVNQEELVTESIEKNAESIVRIYETRPQGTERFYGVGFVAREGVIVSGMVNSYDPGAYYRVVFEDGSDTLVTRLVGEGSVSTLFRITDDTSTPTVEFGDAGALKLGQSLIIIGGENQNVVSVGTLSAVVKDETGAPQNLEISGDVRDRASGAPVVTLQGKLVGMKVYETLADGTVRTRFIPENVLQATLTGAM